MKDRLKELSRLKDGWLNGEGLAPQVSAMVWLEEAWRTHATYLPQPYIYPTLEGGLSLEWDATGNDLSLEVNLLNKTARATMANDETELDLGTDAGWNQLTKLLHGPDKHS